MGGTVAITVRKPDGQEFRMMRWTNALPHFVVNTRLLSKEEEHINDYIKTWQEMKQDYENKQRQLPMSDVYVPYDNKCLYPCGYGLVVVDMVNDVILSLQGYTSLDTFYFARFSNALHEDKMNDNTLSDPKESDTYRLKCFFDEKRILGINRWDEKNQRIVIDKFKIKFDTLTKNIVKYEKKYLHNCFILDMKPFTVKKFEENSIGVEELKKEVLNLGFNLSKEEEIEWEDFKKRFEEEEE